eukprot:TRINITY_DN2747_c2_g4_i1.p1 TRINITY_DN2747_c2_g4~~TRINITY_DN2747_c2_g4_i1.p1  ORF type:complete len:485 (-),score=113.67 TRINITY_DN2747_c2_g4_i1:55-1509(-)
MPKGGAAGQPRKLVSTKRVVGTILDWRGKFGWIQPATPVDHEQASRSNGRIFLAAEDVQEELAGVGGPVTFFLFVDGNGLGAMNVRPTTQEALIAAGGSLAVESAPAEASNGHSKGQAKGQAKGEKGAGHKGGKGGGGYDRGKGGGKFGGGGYRPPHQPPSHDDVLEKVHNVIYDNVWKATKRIAHMETDWDHKELAKRVVKYLYKGAQSPELMQMVWHEAATHFVDHAMQGFSAGCGDKPWFFDLDLSPTFSNAFWELLQASGQHAKWNDVEGVLNAKYEEIMDDALLEKAMWDATEKINHPNLTEPLRNKVYKALKSGHDVALKEVFAEQRVMGDLHKVELFTRFWIDQSMSKSWQSLEDNGIQLSPDIVIPLFQDLLAPFGEDHPFSCIPAALTQKIGRPPNDWPYLTDAVAAYFNEQAGAGAGQKRSYGGRGGGGAKRQRTGDKGRGKGMQQIKTEMKTEPTEDDPVAQALLADIAAGEM